VDEIKQLAADSGLSCAQLAVGVLLATPGLTGSIVGARNARQGAVVADLGVTVTEAQRQAVKDVIARLQRDLDAL
jgi:aryl-alcohol dehydrogenase-like predicted oxidoreductase